MEDQLKHRKEPTVPDSEGFWSRARLSFDGGERTEQNSLCEAVRKHQFVFGHLLWAEIKDSVSGASNKLINT